MTLTSEAVASVVERAKAKVEAIEAKGLSYIPQILDAHRKSVEAQRSGNQRSLDYAFAAGELLIAAKEAIKGQFKWTDWRQEHLSQIPQTTASLYMRVAKGKDRLKSGEISNAVANLAGKGELSIRKAAALLADKKPRGKPPQQKSQREEDMARQYLREVWAPDELVTVLREVRGSEYLAELSAALIKALKPREPEQVPASEFVRRV
jgi:hypothetical protein